MSPEQRTRANQKAKAAAESAARERDELLHKLVFQSENSFEMKFYVVIH